MPGLPWYQQPVFLSAVISALFVFIVLLYTNSQSKKNSESLAELNHRNTKEINLQNLAERKSEFLAEKRAEGLGKVVHENTKYLVIAHKRLEKVVSAKLLFYYASVAQKPRETPGFDEFTSSFDKIFSEFEREENAMRLWFNAEFLLPSSWINISSDAVDSFHKVHDLIYEFLNDMNKEYTIEYHKVRSLLPQREFPTPDDVLSDKRNLHLYESRRYKDLENIRVKIEELKSLLIGQTFL